MGQVVTGQDKEYRAVNPRNGPGAGSGRPQSEGTRTMNRRAIPGAVFLAVAIMFGILGLRDRSQVYLGLGVTFAIIAAAMFRRAKAP